MGLPLNSSLLTTAPSPRFRAGPGPGSIVREGACSLRDTADARGYRREGPPFFEGGGK